MKFFKSILLLTAAVVRAQEPEYPLFYIDLGKAPEERFFEVSKHYSKEIVATMNDFLKEYAPWTYLGLFIADKVTWIWETT